jgi:hypothetical protein
MYEILYTLQFYKPKHFYNLYSNHRTPKSFTQLALAGLVNFGIAFGRYDVILAVISHVTSYLLYASPKLTKPAKASCIRVVGLGCTVIGSLSFTFPGTANGRYKVSWQNFR